MTFREWYDSQPEWWKDCSDKLEEVWNELVAAGVEEKQIARVFDVVGRAFRDQYGD